MSKPSSLHLYAEHSLSASITDLAYKTFYDAIETQSRALLRVTLVRRLASNTFTKI